MIMGSHIQLASLWISAWPVPAGVTVMGPNFVRID
jgi:hypothetical protein